MKGGTMRMGSSAVFWSKVMNTEGRRLRQYHGHGGTGGHGVSYSIVAVRELLSVAAQDGGRFHESKDVLVALISGYETDKAKKIPEDGRYNPRSYG